MGSLVGPKGIMHALLLLFLLQQSSTLVGAYVDITFFESTSRCSGLGSSCSGINSDVCCFSSDGTGAVAVTTSSGAGCLGASYFTYGGCTQGNYIDSSFGNYCFDDPGYSNAEAFWFNSCQNRRRSLLGGLESKATTCTGQMKPNAVVYTEDGTKGHWILTSSNTSELYSQLKNVNEAERLVWIKSKGASYKALDSKMQLASEQHD